MLVQTGVDLNAVDKYVPCACAACDRRVHQGATALRRAEYRPCPKVTDILVRSVVVVERL
jgi:hypothetical protein